MIKDILKEECSLWPDISFSEMEDFSKPRDFSPPVASGNCQQEQNQISHSCKQVQLPQVLTDFPGVSGRGYLTGHQHPWLLPLLMCKTCSAACCSAGETRSTNVPLWIVMGLMDHCHQDMEADVATSRGTPMSPCLSPWRECSRDCHGKPPVPGPPAAAARQAGAHGAEAGDAFRVCDRWPCVSASVSPAHTPSPAAVAARPDTAIALFQCHSSPTATDTRAGCAASSPLRGGAGAVLCLLQRCSHVRVQSLERCAAGIYHWGSAQPRECLEHTFSREPQAGQLGHQVCPNPVLRSHGSPYGGPRYGRGWAGNTPLAGAELMEAQGQAKCMEQPFLGWAGVKGTSGTATRLVEHNKPTAFWWRVEAANAKPLPARNDFLKTFWSLDYFTSKNSV